MNKEYLIPNSKIPIDFLLRDDEQMNTEILNYYLFISAILAPIFTGKQLYPATFLSTIDGVIEANVSKHFGNNKDIIAGTTIQHYSITHAAAAILQAVKNLSRDKTIEKMKENEKKCLRFANVSEGEVVDVLKVSAAVYDVLLPSTKKEICKEHNTAIQKTSL